MPEKMLDMGITADCKISYQQGLTCFITFCLISMYLCTIRTSDTYPYLQYFKVHWLKTMNQEFCLVYTFLIDSSCMSLSSIGPYLVLTLTIIAADSAKIIEKKAGKDKASQLTQLFDMVGIDSIKSTLDDNLVALIARYRHTTVPPYVHINRYSLLYE